MAQRPLNIQQAQAMGVRGLALSGDIDAPAVEISAKFTTQSYFDTTLLEAAILRQPPNEQIVPSTKKSSDLAGYALGLHPSSQTPIAVQFKGGQQQGTSSVFRLKPGEVLRPFGSPGAPGRFSGFDWGIPFGWLGGGNATLVVFRTSDATVDWLDRSEVIFHRTRLPIYAQASVPSAPAYNWPTRFPWPFASQGTNAFSQRGTPILAVTPTRTLATLRPAAALVASETMRMYFVGSDEFAETSTGTIPLTEAVAHDVVWNTWSSLASANFATQYQYQFLPEAVTRMAANAGGVILVDLSGGLAGSYVDVVRYGVL